MTSSSKLLLFGIVAALVVGGGAYVATHIQPMLDNGHPPVCTLEAKICPDGSAVGRTGPNCEFAQCPASAATTTTSNEAASIGKAVRINGTSIVVLELLEDSRCPADVQCIQAGTVRVRAALDAYNRDFTFVLGQPQAVGNATITLVSVQPSEKHAGVVVNPNQYRFMFSVERTGQAAKGLLSGALSIGPNCPVEQAGVPCNPTPEAYAAHKVFIYTSDKKTLLYTLTPDAQGKFSIPLSTGEYVVDVAHQAVGGVSGAPAVVHITSNITTNITISIDTGIR